MRTKPHLHIIQNRKNIDVVALCESPAVKHRFYVTKSSVANMNADLTFCQTYAGREILNELIKLRGKNYVIHMGGDIWYELGRLGANSKVAMIDDALRNATAVIANSKFLSGIIKRKLKTNNVMYLECGLWGTDHTRYGIQLSRFKRKTGYAMGEVPLIVMNMSLTVEKKYKGINYFMDACGNLIRRFNAKVVCTGKIKPAIALDLQQKYSIQFTGYIENWPDFLRKADVFVHPSTFDCFPRAVGDAMCSAVPGLAFNTGGTPEVSDTILMCDHKDSLDQWAKLKEILKSRNFREVMGVNMYDEAVERTVRNREYYANLLYGIVEAKRGYISC